MHTDLNANEQEVIIHKQGTISMGAETGGPRWQEMRIQENVDLVSELEVKRLVKQVTEYALEIEKTSTQYEKDMLKNSYAESEMIAKRLKKVLTRQGARGMVLDLMLAGALLAQSFKPLENFKDYHPIEFEAIVRKHKLNDGVPDQVLDGVCRIVRSYLGPNTPLNEFIPKPGSPEYLVATAYELLQD